MIGIALEKGSEMQVTFDDIIKLATIIMLTWGFAKVIMEIIKAVTTRHDREQKWDEMAESINSSRENIIQKYDFKLAEMEKKIDENHADTESKLQQLGAEMYMHTEVLNAILDGLTQLGANGKVTEAKEKMADFMNRAAHM